VITTGVRSRLAELGNADPEKVILADSRERIGLFRSVWLKPNLKECLQATGGSSRNDPASSVRELATRTGRPVFCTRAEQGILAVDPRSNSIRTVEVSAYPVTGPIDIVGAGDSANAGIACALAVGADLEQAASFGCLMASITIRQIGTTGTATPEQIRDRWRDVSRAS
jgi:sugar/nucleoside kinase (ribokinase family)